MKREGVLLHDQTAADTFTEFVRGLEPGLRRGLTAGFGSEVGREAAAEALVYGWQHWERIRGMANAEGYLFRVGQNKARRLVARRRWVSRDEIVFVEPWAEPAFGSAWWSLSDRQRIVVGLVHGFDWSLGEVAKLLGVSRGAVQSYENRGLQKLRRDLGVEG
jgi:DNA-directed RNA polymerase specialized sigma24 family protein